MGNESGWKKIERNVPGHYGVWTFDIVDRQGNILGDAVFGPCLKTEAQEAADHEVTAYPDGYGYKLTGFEKT